MPHGSDIVPSLSSKRETREHLEKVLRRNLIGPGWSEGTTDPDYHEILTLGDRSVPDRWYMTGYISPRCIDEEELPPDPNVSIQTAQSSEEIFDNSLSESVSRQKKDLSPRSIGLSSSPSPDCKSVDIKFEWGEYRLNEKQNNDSSTWKREPKSYSINVNISEFLNQEETYRPESHSGIRFHIKMTNRGNKSILTTRVINDRTYEKKDWKKRAESNIHQMKISLKGKFQDIRVQSPISDRGMDLLYHYSKVLSYGHNIGVGWSDEEDEIWSDYMPRHEVPLMTNREGLQELIPKFKDLTDPESIFQSVQSVESFIGRYEEWIMTQESQFNSSQALHPYKAEFDSNLHRARENIERMRRGASLLLSDSKALEAFRLANKAIWLSQTSDTLDELHRIPDFEWRPFQFAFQLVNLEGALVRDSEDRGIVDLAWFPTGGGKTEAYLGLIALVSFYRRINPETAIIEQRSPSIHTIMRYTLRLLTADQAGRLVRAVGAMNQVALHEGLSDGFPPFRVGMWVGAKSSPNRLFKDSNQEYKSPPSANDLILDAKADRNNSEASVSQFQHCPWCGDPSVGDQSRYSITARPWSQGRPTLHASCQSTDCPFNEELPFTCVDDDIYLNPPTVLLATADKFVQIAHNHNAKSIKYSPNFNSINGEQYTIRRMMGFEDEPSSPDPPDLVIQDELHLLTGPLGTVAGLFETALDLSWQEACNGHRIKYVAATATIRGAERDVGLMYGRDLNVFPPPLLSANDNFFAEERPTDKVTGRLHLGLLAPSGKGITSADQTVASMLQSVGSLHEEGGTHEEHLDPYWTIVMYYNSLRELGAGQSSLTQNIPRWMSSYSRGIDLREIRLNRELTSRRSSNELTQYRSDLNRTLTEGDAVDVLSTSNMFQVGIDIPRLGTMMILGQPRSNSEYIQSSGRVGRGRNSAGIVISVLRGTYPRDQSHYELFRSFHQEFYRHVDMTSITPFAHRALDKAFETTMMMMLRMSFPALSESNGPEQLSSRHNVRTKANSFMQGFYEVVRKRMEKYESSDIDEGITNSSIDVIKNLYERLKNHSKIHTREGRKLHWIIWNETQRKKGELSFFSSPFRSKNPTGEEDIASSIGSMRDVSDEVLMFQESREQRFRTTTTLPESHLFGHASPGSIWEHGGIPYLTGGIPKWELGTYEQQSGALSEKTRDPQGLLIDEPVLNQVFGQSKFISLPKATSRDMESKWLYEKTPAVAFTTFPNIWVCSDSKEAHIQDGMKWDKDANQSVCLVCDKPTAPSRFVSLCKRGHIHRFDYFRWAHHGSKTKCDYASADLVIEFGPDASFSLRDWVVRCRTCDASQDLNDAIWVDENDRRAQKCQGRRPWLDFNRADEPCDQVLENKEVGNTAVSFNESSSLMLIPPYVTWNLGDQPDFTLLLEQENRQMMFDAWAAIQELPAFARQRDRINLRLKETQWAKDHSGFLERMDEYRQLNDGTPLSIETLKTRERRGFVLEDADLSGIDPDRFQCRPIAGNSEPTPDGWSDSEWPILSLSRVDRLTELRVIHGIRRLDPNSEFDPQPIDSSDVREGPNQPHGIAMYNYGEGVYFDIKPEWLQKIAIKRSEANPPHRVAMSHSFDRIHTSVRAQNPALKSPSNPLSNSAFTILHTLSHLVIRELSAMSGFALGSIRERLFFDFINEEDKVRSCGILVYTSGASTDGTLGGLVQQASSIERVENVFKRALESREMCSNDPVCMEHDPVLNEPNGAACHSCVLLPETSCEFQNQMLDRNWG